MDEVVVPVDGLVVQMEVTGSVAPPPPSRQSISWRLVVLAVVALRAVGAGVALVRRAEADRRVAIAERQHVETQLSGQRSSTEATDAQVDEDRDRVNAYGAATAAPLATA